MASTRIAAIGDVHGCVDEFRELIRILQHSSIDSIWHLGDLVDRGPDSGAVVQTCREEGIRGVMGNHESTIVSIYEKVRDGARKAPPDKMRTCESLQREDFEHIRDLPLMHVFDDIKVALVHAGVEPRLPPYKDNLSMHHFFASQTHSVCHVQLVHPEHQGKTRWWGWDPKNECSEEENRKNGWVRWYELYDEPYIIAYGHSVYFNRPYQHGRTVGVDTGCVHGGALTAVILPDMQYVQVPAKKAYCPRKKSKTPYNTDP